MGSLALPRLLVDRPLWLEPETPDLFRQQYVGNQVEPSLIFPPGPGSIARYLGE